MVWKKVVNSDVGDDDHFGGDDIDKVSDLFSGVDVDDLDINSETSFRDQKLKLRNPANTQALTFRSPAIASSKDWWTTAPITYFIWKDGSTYYARSGATGAVDYSGTSAATVIQSAITALAATGGLIHLAAATYFIDTQITIPQHAGLSYIIEGDGWRNTVLAWSGSASGTAYVIEAYSTLSTGWQVVTFRDLQIYGGTSTSNRLVKCLHIGRDDTGAAAIFYFYNVRFANAISPQIVANYIQDSYWHAAYAESYSGSPTPIVDLQITGSSHINLYGCTFGAITVDSSRFNCFGGTIGHLDLKTIANYTCMVSGTAFDPVPTGFTHQVKVGSTGNVIGATFDNLTFLADTNTPATDRYLYLNNCTNCIIREPKFTTASTSTVYLEITSSAVSPIVWWPSQEALSKISNSSTTATIYNPFINNTLTINNPSGTAGATIIDNFTSNRLELAQGTNNIDLGVKKNSGTPRIRLKSRNAANSADVLRFQTGANLQDQGLSPNESYENLIFIGGTSLVPFLKAGTPVDGDFLNPVSGLVVLDTTNGIWYARVGSTWTALGGNTIGLTKGGTGQVTAAASFNALSPLTTSGDVLYGGASGAGTRLAGNITTTRQFIAQTGNGSVSAAPAWVTPKSVMAFDFMKNVTLFQVAYTALGSLNGSTTEANIDTVFSYAMTVKRIRGFAQTNTMNGNTIIAFRDDAADVGATTIAASTAGEFDSGALSVAVAAGSKIDWKVDSTASSSGAINLNAVCEVEIELQ